MEWESNETTWFYQQKTAWKKWGKGIHQKRWWSNAWILSRICKKIKPLPPEPQLSDFYHPSKTQKTDELLFFAVGTGIATYALYKYLK